MKFLIAGLGSIGRRHLRHLNDIGENDIILYRTNNSTLPDDLPGNIIVETNLDNALSHKPNAAIISNPTALHLKVATPIVKTGCHLLIEKPISNDLSEIAEFEKVVSENDARVLVGFQFRYHPGLRKIAELVKEETVGRPISFRAHWGEYLPDWHPWEDYRQGYAARKDLGGGVLLTLSHPFDYSRMIFGEVNTLSAFAGQLSDLEIDVEDTAEILLQFESGVLGSLHLDFNQRPPKHTFEVICTGGTIVFDKDATALNVYNANDEKWQAYPFPKDFERDHLFREQMKHFLEVVNNDAAPNCSLKDGVKAQKLVTAALKASKDNVVIKKEDL